MSGPDDHLIEVWDAGGAGGEFGEGPRTWTIEVNDLGRPLTMNESRTLHPFARAKVDKLWRFNAQVAARQGKVPRLDRIRVEVTPLHRDGRSPQDCAACAPAAKAAVDGMVDALVIDDDDPKHLESILFHQPEVCGRDGLRLQIIEIGAP